MGDHDLLQAYVRERSEDAFTALARRYMDFVYSAARRQVRCPALADEVTQSVFLDLARTAHRLRPAPSLAPWLFVVTRRTALDELRRNRRRRNHEQAAASGAATVDSLPPVWGEVEPWLDEAIGALNEEDRRAILLRFFQNQTLRQVGAALGTSEDTAQKRVARALERLREHLRARGVSIGVTGLASLLPSHGVQAAPSAVGATWLSATAAKGAAATTAPLILMTTLQKVLASAALVVAVGATIHHVQELSDARLETASLRQRLDVLVQENARLQNERDEAALHLVNANRELGTYRDLAQGADPAIESALEAWLERVQLLSTWLDRLPERRIPEMALLKEEDWLEAAKSADLSSEVNARDAIANLRRLALGRFMKPMTDALQLYLKDHGELPPDGTPLGPYFNPPVDADLLRNYIREEIGGRFSMMGRDGKPAELALFSKSVDELNDTRFAYTKSGVTVQNLFVGRDLVTAAVKAYQQANGGQSPRDPAALKAHLSKPLPDEYVAKVLPDILKYP